MRELASDERAVLRQLADGCAARMPNSKLEDAAERLFDLGLVDCPSGTSRTYVITQNGLEALRRI
jgi:RIO-like serine/threonine protein kinase